MPEHWSAPGEVGVVAMVAMSVVMMMVIRIMCNYASGKARDIHNALNNCGGKK